jgi:hypothetical protein
MRSIARAFLIFLMALCICRSIACSEKTTEPEKPPAPDGKHLWSKRFGDAATQMAYRVAIDASGSVILAGVFMGSVDFGGGALTGSGSDDVFVAKLASDGSHLWSKSFGDANYQHVEDVAVDPSGNVVITGCFNGTVDFGGGALTSAGSSDIFVAKFGPDGTHLWSKRFGGATSQVAHGVIVDASENVIIAGYFFGSVDFGGGSLTSAGASDIFVDKFGRDGAHIWSKRFGDADSQGAYGVAVDASGNVIVSGDFVGAVDFGGGALTSAGLSDIFVAKFGPDGAHLWSRRFGDACYQRVDGVAVDASGNVIVTGNFEGAVDFGGGALSGAIGGDIYVAKFGPDGAHLWSMQFGDAESQFALDAAVDASRNVIIVGCFFGTVDFGGDALQSSGSGDIYVAKFGPDGAHLWSQRFGDAHSQTAYGVAIDTSGNAVVTGYFDGAVDFGGGALMGSGDFDAFAAKFGK